MVVLGVVNTSVVVGSVRVVDSCSVVEDTVVVVVTGIGDVGLSLLVLLAQGGGVVSDLEQFLGGCTFSA